MKPNLQRGALLASLAALLLFAGPVWAQASSLEALYMSATGWVKPGETYPFVVNYAVSAATDGATVTATLPAEAIYESANPAPTAGDGTPSSPLEWSLAPGTSGKIIVWARALDLTEDPTMIWKDLSAETTFESTLGGNPVESLTSRTLGPKCTTHESARYGVRPFPLVMVEYQDIKHCVAEGDPYPECTGNHTAEALDAAVNSKTSGRSLWQLYNEMSFGQLLPQGQVGPAPGVTEVAFESGYPFKWSSLEPNGACNGATIAGSEGTPVYPNRIDNGWYVLPGTQGYYGSDRTGHGLVGAVTGVGLVFGIDDACGPTAKITYDAAAIADPDLDYNEFDTDKDGVVDFFNVAFAGEGGNGNISTTGINNVWPHKSDLRFYFTDANGETGYVSNDQLRNHVEELMYWTDATRTEMTTTDTGIPVWVRVGPYNVNPEAAIEKMSVIAHEYGHSLGLPDYYSLGSRETFGSWELMASDHAQFMSVFNRQELGWIVPVEAEDGSYELRESKIDTGEIHWKTPDDVPYTLTGPGIHNADALRVGLPTVKLIDSVPSGVRAWHSGQGNDFGCPPADGHNLDFFLPELDQYAGAGSIELSLQSLFEIEWDWDYAFLLASIDGGVTWQSLPSLENTTITAAEYNPNAIGCFSELDNGITGVSGLPNEVTTTERVTGDYPEAVWITDRFDLTPFAGEKLLLRFSYFTDPAVAKRGWFIDDMQIEADGQTIYASDFETFEHSKIFPDNWTLVSSADGVDADHAYYVEVRDRVSWDFDGKEQSDRGAPTWEGGLAILYTDESHGYGNTGVDNPPAQTIVDSIPSPGDDTPNLDDAAFTTGVGRDFFDGCTHVDNYDTPEGLWKLPNGVNLWTDGLTGLSVDGAPTGAAQAIVTVDVDPDCDLVTEPPVIAFGAGHEDPDPNGSYELTWDRPAAASGPDQLQEATLLATLFSDDAESGMGNWDVSSDGLVISPWDQSAVKSNSGTYSFFTVADDDARNTSSIMTLASPLAVPVGSTILTFYDLFAGELDDLGFVEVSTDGGSRWEEVYQTSGPVLAEEIALALAEPLQPRQVDLSPYAGQTIELRFRYFVGASNYLFYTPVGWFVDDVQIDTANWTDIAVDLEGTSFVRSGLTDGTYHYRVRTAYAAGSVSIDSPWSNVITTDVVRVNQAPTAVDDSATTDQDQSVTIDVLANDGDDDGDVLSVTGASQGLNGSTTINANGTITYTPNAGFTGNDAFTYTISDGNGGSDSATVSVSVTPNQAPTAANDAATTEEGQSVTIDVLANDSDADGDSLSVSAVTQPAHGASEVNGDATVTYTPNAGFIGTDAFTYTISDGRGGSAGATVSVMVQSTNQGPSAVNDYAVTDEDMAVTVVVLANDSDPDGDSLTVSGVSQPAHGLAEVNGDGSITYTPDAGFFGTDAFTYTISDGRGGSSSATVSVNVRATGGGGGNGGDSDHDSDDADSDGVSNHEDSDDDNDGVSDDQDSDDDGDGIEDEFDSPTKKEKKSKKSDHVAPNVSSSYTMRVTEGSLMVVALVESAQAELLTVEIYDPTGSLVGTSLPAPGRALATTVPLSSGDYTVMVRNAAAEAVDYDITLIGQVPWPAI
jgi:M6 family metalloprotease-like protein